MDQHVTVGDQRVSAALTELQALIRGRYPDATFAVFRRDDREGIRQWGTVAHASTDGVLDAVIDRLYELQVEHGLPIYVIPVQPPFEGAEQLRTGSTQPAAANPSPSLPR